MSCCVCNCRISSRAPGVKCVCDLSYHAKCVNLSKTQLEEIKTGNLLWKCDKCRSKKGRKSLVYEIDEDNQDEADEGDIEINAEDVSISYGAVCDQLKNILSVQKVFQDSLSTFSNLIDDFSRKMKTFEQKSKAIDKLSSDNVAIKSTVTNLDKHLMENDQMARMNDVEFVGIPQNDNENLIHMVKAIGLTLNCPLIESDIDYIHRVQCFDKTKTKNIILRCQSRLTKNNLIAAARQFIKKKGVFKPADINLVGNHPIFVNEHLIPSKKLLFKDARKFCKDNNIKFLWVKDCKIFARKNDTSKIKIISDLEDLKKI